MPSQTALKFSDDISVTQLRGDRSTAGSITSYERLQPRSFWRRASAVTAAATAIAFSSAEIEQAHAANNVATLARPQDADAQRAVLLPPQLASSIAEIEALREMSDGWDGPASVAPKASIIERAVRFLKQLPESVHAPEPCPLPDGAVQWVWSNDDGYATVYFGPGLAASYYGTSGGHVAKGWLWVSDKAVPEDLWKVLSSL